ncbi:CAF17-like 4Fe-4S cluster assembly/insertion protein YgfZ [Pontivivens insulae]|uniref:tRNA-modifying protein YgfZ n=1 Tax=Pontivivens insulae TaxID=1639689 RepID=A0A2R8ACG1_9RHOB|nr:folate-binding protein YgfZ [Pontivivens insulae]RED11065.1 hypothetical protein DFR53_3094 [Pontivivens insulae]SPF29760.1 tRNA-modifying protein YgfZ [Pontivivens insulae]
MTHALSNRTILRLTGGDVIDFLQGLVTNDVSKLQDAPVWAAILTPQGKYLCDFFLIAQGDAVLLDVQSDQAAGLARRLTMYRLRADVQITPTDMSVAALDQPVEDAIADPRDPRMGWRLYGASVSEGMTRADYDARRVAYLVPETGIELVPDESYILESGFERLNGVDFRKGCYVGQEVTARMKHKTELRKGLSRVSVEGPAPSSGTPITAGEKAVGTLFTVSGNEGLAHLRFDRATGDMQAGEAVLRRID